MGRGKGWETAFQAHETVCAKPWSYQISVCSGTREKCITQLLSQYISTSVGKKKGGA